MVVITACPYSGTKYTATLLNEIGLDVGHEKMSIDGIVSWQHTHFTADDFDPKSILLHQVRHPLMVISQMSVIDRSNKHPNGYFHLRDQMNKQTFRMGMELSLADGLVWAMNIWYTWIRYAIAHSKAWYKIETLERQWQSFLGTIGMDHVDMPAIKKTTNRHGNQNIRSWDDLYRVDKELTLKIMGLATALGYSDLPKDYLDDNFYNFPESFCIKRL